jgi:hypothetical protein
MEKGTEALSLGEKARGVVSEVAADSGFGQALIQASRPRWTSKASPQRCPPEDAHGSAT